MLYLSNFGANPAQGVLNVTEPPKDRYQLSYGKMIGDSKIPWCYDGCNQVVVDDAGVISVVQFPDLTEVDESALITAAFDAVLLPIATTVSYIDNGQTDYSVGYDITFTSPVTLLWSDWRSDFKYLSPVLPENVEVLATAPFIRSPHLTPQPPELQVRIAESQLKNVTGLHQDFAITKTGLIGQPKLSLEFSSLFRYSVHRPGLTIPIAATSDRVFVCQGSSVEVLPTI